MKEYSKRPKAKEKIKLRNKAYKKTNNYKNSNLKHYFKITFAEYQELLLKQKGVCAICHLPETAVASSGKIKMLAVDHCHTTGKVRGLLCGNCNRGIGMFQDSIKNLLSAATYLETER